MTDRYFPLTRLRRLRQKPFIREMVQESRLNSADLIWPLFVCDGDNKIQPIDSMPSVNLYSIDQIVQRANYAHSLNLPAIALFPHTPKHLKDKQGSEAFNDQNLICQAIRAVKSACPEIGIICDVALDPYTDHGHDGVLNDDGIIDNDKTIESLISQSKILADAGCDIIAPSDMMDGRIKAIRTMLEDHDHKDMMVMSYAAKYASAFYGPFRDAIGAGRIMDKEGKKSYQMNPANTDEALREIAMDINEGADMVMVKPAMPYLDIIRRVHDGYNIPCFAYQVSGEYAMLMAAIGNGWLEKDAVIYESLLCLKRAGASGILTYFADEIAEKLSK